MAKINEALTNRDSFFTKLKDKALTAAINVVILYFVYQYFFDFSNIWNTVRSTNKNLGFGETDIVT